MAVVKAQATITLALVNDGKAGATGATGPQGKTGATGPQGPAGKDITSYAKGTALPSTVAAANSQFWLLNSSGQCTSVYVSDGSKWVATPISASLIVAATYKGMTFEGVTFKGSEFTSPFTETVDGTTYTGTMQMKGGHLSIDGSYSSSGSSNAVDALISTGSIEMNTYAGAKGATVVRSSSLTPGELGMFGPSKAEAGFLTGDDLARFNVNGSVLWSGGVYMQDSQVITPTIPISECSHGWELIWSYYSGSPQNNNWSSFFVTKEWVEDHSGNARTMLISSTSSTIVPKYCYFRDTTITGYADNAKSTGDSKKFVLREVRAW